MTGSVTRCRLVRVTFRLLLCAAMAGLVSCSSAPEPAGSAPDALQAAGATGRVPNDPDDPAIWIHPTTPALSLIVTTDKHEGTGGLYVFGFDGRLKQAITPVDRPNNVDIEYGVRVGGRTVDVAVVTERKQRRLRVFAIDTATGRLDDVAPDGIPVLRGVSGIAGEPMGMALYRRQTDGAIYAIVAPKAGPATGYLWQYRLVDDGQTLRADLVRRFGTFSRVGAVPGEEGEIEAVVVDDELGFVYYADERFGIRKWHADPDHPEAGRELAVIGTDGYLGDREGLAIVAEADGRGFLISSDQVTGGTRLHVYPREGTPRSPHDHPRLAIVSTEADETDGLEVTRYAVPGYPEGALVMMNSAPKNFLIFDWRSVAARLPAAWSR